LDLQRQAYDDMYAETAETSKTISDALSARIEAEVAVLRDEFIERLDTLLLNHAPRKLRAMEAAIRNDMNERASDLDERLDKLVMSVDAVDKRRRYDRNCAHKEKNEQVAKITALFTAMSARNDKRVTELAEEIKALRAVLVEAEIVAPDPPTLMALLPPA
jgi:hypothetical protein